MYLLGAHLPDQKLVRIALTSFYGINHATARKLCARLQLHEAATVSSLNDNQVNALSAYLSSPSSIPAQKPSPTSPIIEEASSSSNTLLHPASTATTPSQYSSASNDPLRSIVLESDLKRMVQSNINHHRITGTYKGRRHSQGLPVRGQRTRTNALTAKKMNRPGRGIMTWARQSSNTNDATSIARLIEPLRSAFRS